MLKRTALLHFFELPEYVISVEETLRTIPGCAEAVAESFTAAQELSMDVEGRKQLNQWLQSVEAMNSIYSHSNFTLDKQSEVY